MCAVTRAISRAEGRGADGEVETTLPCLPELSDLCLKEMFGSVLSAGEVKNDASGYSLQHGILVMKWVPHGEDFVGEPIFQVVMRGQGTWESEKLVRGFCATSFGHD